VEAQRDDREATSLAEYLGESIAAARRRWWLLVLVPLLLAGAAYWLGSRQPVTYTASATILVTQPSPQGSGLSSDVWSGTILAPTYAQLVTAPPLLERVIAELGLDWTVPELAGHVSASAQVQTLLVTISGTASDPQLAADLANATGRAFAAWVAELQTTRSSASAKALQDGIDQARANIEKTTSEIDILSRGPGGLAPETQTRIANLGTILEQQQDFYTGLLELQQRLELEELALQGQARLVSPATLPGPDRQLTLVYTAIAFVFGLGLAGMGTVLLERLNRRVRSPRDVQRAIDQPVLAVLPRARSMSTVDLLATPDSPASKAVRSLSVRLRVSANGRGLGTIMVTSITSNPETVTLGANLAVALAEIGQRVILVDGNVRSPRLHKLFGVSPSTLGLANLLAQPDTRVEGLLVEGPRPYLRLLLAGTSTQPPEELLAGNRLTGAVSALRAIADVVIIGAPPLRESTSDALLLAAPADRALVVVDAGRTHPQELQTALADLTITGVGACGVVLADTGRSLRA
jgi:non-specific protein-tyrosine kinase